MGGAEQGSVGGTDCHVQRFIGHRSERGNVIGSGGGV